MLSSFMMHGSWIDAALVCTQGFDAGADFVQYALLALAAHLRIARPSLSSSIQGRGHGIPVRFRLTFAASTMRKEPAGHF